MFSGTVIGDSYKSLSEGVKVEYDLSKGERGFETKNVRITDPSSDE